MTPDLTTALRSLASGEALAPGEAPGDLADRALERAHQRGRRNLTAVAGAALAVVLVVGTVLTSLHGTADGAAPAHPAPKSTSVLDRPRVNVLLVGSDAADDRVGTRPDTIIVSSIDTRTGATTLFGLPRNLEHMPFRPGTPQARAFPAGFSCPDQGSGHDCLLNAVWQWAETAGREYYPRSPGLSATTEVVEQATGLSMDETVVVTMKGLQSLVDAVGGVDVTVRERLPIGGNSENPRAQGWIEKGRQHLNGYQALWYARSRWSTNDYSRMARQQCLLTGLIAQLDGTDLRNAAKLMTTLRENLTTSISLREVPGWVALGQQMRDQPVTRVELIPPDRTDPDFPRMREDVTEALAGHRVEENPDGSTC
jgi:LCP family protein required for cell wall assembly